MQLTLPKIYPITDTRISGLSHPEQVRRLIAGGATLIQLREKTGAPAELYEAALASVEIARKHGARIIINDRVDIALAAGADGVHLGQDDLPPENARSILGPDAIIGYSTHTVDQVRRAATLPVDYIAIGPVFETRTKADPDAVVGLDGVREARVAAGTLPLVAIGGLSAGSIPSVLAAGADCVAIISCLLSGGDSITERIREMVDSMG